MFAGFEKQLLKGVSRSFYLSLRLLPAPMRNAASLAYLLARTSDTLADTITVPLETRLKCLDQFRGAVAGNEEVLRWPIALLNAIPEWRERRLLESSDEILKGLGNLGDAEASLVRQVVELIISGQILDLQRFTGATQENLVALKDDATLDDYAWRVAGCVGAFWTQLGFLTMGERFSQVSQAVLLEQGIAYGKGLQLVNILRDLASDLAIGRCYLPVTNPFDSRQLLDCHGRWLNQADEWLKQGSHYATSLRTCRLRAATVLPAMIAEKTLAALRGATWEELQQRIKVPRSEVYQAVIRALFHPHR